jgi:hypothetical protein
MEPIHGLPDGARVDWFAGLQPTPDFLQLICARWTPIAAAYWMRRRLPVIRGDFAGQFDASLGGMQIDFGDEQVDPGSDRWKLPAWRESAQIAEILEGGNEALGVTIR